MDKFLDRYDVAIGVAYAIALIWTFLNAFIVSIPFVVDWGLSVIAMVAWFVIYVMYTMRNY